MNTEERIQKMIEFQKKYNAKCKKISKDNDRSKEPLRFGIEVKKYVDPKDIDLTNICVYAWRGWFAYDYPEEFSRWYALYVENPSGEKIKTSYDDFYKKLAIF